MEPIIDRERCAEIATSIVAEKFVPRANVRIAATEAEAANEQNDDDRESFYCYCIVTVLYCIRCEVKYLSLVEGGYFEEFKDIIEVDCLSPKFCYVDLFEEFVFVCEKCSFFDCLSPKFYCLD